MQGKDMVRMCSIKRFSEAGLPLMNLVPSYGFKPFECEGDKATCLFIFILF